VKNGDNIKTLQILDTQSNKYTRYPCLSLFNHFITTEPVSVLKKEQRNVETRNNWNDFGYIFKDLKMLIEETHGMAKVCGVELWIILICCARGRELKIWTHKNTEVLLGGMSRSVETPAIEIEAINHAAKCLRDDFEKKVAAIEFRNHLYDLNKFSVLLKNDDFTVGTKVLGSGMSGPVVDAMFGELPAAYKLVDLKKEIAIHQYLTSEYVVEVYGICLEE